MQQKLKNHTISILAQINTILAYKTHVSVSNSIAYGIHKLSTIEKELLHPHSRLFQHIHIYLIISAYYHLLVCAYKLYSAEIYFPKKRGKNFIS